MSPSQFPFFFPVFCNSTTAGRAAGGPGILFTLDLGVPASVYFLHALSPSWPGDAGGGGRFAAGSCIAGGRQRTRGELLRKYALPAMFQPAAGRAAHGVLQTGPGRAQARSTAFSFASINHSISAGDHGSRLAAEIGSSAACRGTGFCRETEPLHPAQFVPDLIHHPAH